MEALITTNGRPLNEILRVHARWVDGEPTAFRCILDRETLNEAKLPGVNLQGALLRGTTFLDAELSGADLSKTEISGADFERALLSGVDLSSAQISDSQFSFALLATAI